MRVLEDNWTGASTVPSRSLYPHQWSWDSAFIAIGLRHLSPLRAQRELETLLDAQWEDGRIPHIVFNPSVPLDAYFPSPDFWRSSTAGRAAGTPRTVQTSGIVQPPVHALAAWLVHCADPGLSRARGFLTRVYPRLAAWHRYLLHRRDLGGGGLVSVVHPWEQGMDNSPCWDAPLARVTPAPARSFRRADLDHGAAEDRPTDLDYGRYVRLATDYRDREYADGASEFAVEDPSFNALLIASEHALSRVADELGATGAARRARAERLTTAMLDRLWDPTEQMFFCRDVRSDELIPERSVSGLLPLLLPTLPRGTADALVRTTRGPHFGLGSSTRLPRPTTSSARPSTRTATGAARPGSTRAGCWSGGCAPTASRRWPTRCGRPSWTSPAPPGSRSTWTRTPARRAVRPGSAGPPRSRWICSTCAPDTACPSWATARSTAVTRESGEGTGHDGAASSARARRDVRGHGRRRGHQRCPGIGLPGRVVRA